MTITVNISVTGPVYVQQLSDADRDFIRVSLQAIMDGQTNVLKGQVKMSAELDKLEADVAAEATVVDSAIALLQGLKAALDAAGTDPAKLAALSASIEEKTAALASAVTTNTPAA